MNSDLRTTLVTCDYAAAENLLRTPIGRDPAELRDKNIDHYLVAAMIETESPIIAQAILVAHYKPDGCFLADSINAACHLLLAEAATRPEGIEHFYGMRVKQLLIQVDDASAQDDRAKQVRHNQTEKFLGACYEMILKLVPDARTLLLESFMTYNPGEHAVPGARYPGCFEFNYKLLQSLGVSSDVMRLRNREVIDAQFSQGKPDKAILSLCQGTADYDHEYLARIVEFEARKFVGKGIISLKDGDRREWALHLARTCSPDEPRLLARSVCALLPKALKPEQMKTATTVELMGRLLDHIESPMVANILFRNLTDNTLLSTTDIGSLVRTVKDFQYARDSGKFDLQELLNVAPEAIRTYQLEADLGL
ncbi:hypothetical protein DV532_27815 (plasmid) [Pseudomonas sp. Leaf58]|uniref:hypothetical protein n=2 Tax=Pseudomonas sp. Leaf58 TaxID=1736226 RepID=UPI0006F71B85|nr:hypothetical protein [Pseudomonas sp. Leaf58]AYG48089.1 hypothetical protein DV532_27815 [Pseudomonas sp. Leaf58]KQN62356.1 hypothetical protein ASF02_09400 [Pseudomonas sp. Leaf58]